ncbi:MAG: hypothetical protein HZA49_02460 [Planctomycetes bacterium]|nr:hypothetical protein [Planctomycetota bacterium]
MFERKKIETMQIKISICKDVLEAIFDECDKNKINETGGRIVGFFAQQDNKVEIKVCALIAPGPNARKSPVSFFQDGEYQEMIFRKIESSYPEIEALGNWHTHHVNGLDALSRGDIETYTRTVNHTKHNIDFFYALLVTSKNDAFFKHGRYIVKHFLFKKGAVAGFEIPHSKIKIIKEPAIFIDRGEDADERPNKEVLTDTTATSQIAIKQIRTRDKEIISKMYPDIETFLSKQTNSILWRGNIKLIDDSLVEILIAESILEDKPLYYIVVSSPNGQFFKCNKLYMERSFDSAWKALYLFERDLNREIFKGIENSPKIKSGEPEPFS